MLDDVGLVIRRARRGSLVDAEDFEEADRDGQCDCLHIEGGHGTFACYGTIGMEVDMIAAIDELHEGEEPGDIDVAALAAEFGVPVKINGMPVDPDVDEVAAHEMDLGKPTSPFEDNDVLPGPHDPDANERIKVCQARQQHGCDNWSQIHKIDDQKRPGRRNGRRVVRAIKEGRLAA